MCTIRVIMACIVVYGDIHTCDFLNYCMKLKVEEISCMNGPLRAQCEQNLSTGSDYDKDNAMGKESEKNGVYWNVS